MHKLVKLTILITLMIKKKKKQSRQPCNFESSLTLNLLKIPSSTDLFHSQNVNKNTTPYNYYEIFRVFFLFNYYS